MMADDGRGCASQGGWGLAGMQKWAALVSGELVIRSAPERGTTVLRRLPLQGGEGGEA